MYSNGQYYQVVGALKILPAKFIYIISFIYNFIYPISRLQVPNGVHYDKIIPIDDILQGEFTRYNSFLEFVLYRNNLVLARTFYFPSSFSSAQAVKDPKVDVRLLLDILLIFQKSNIYLFLSEASNHQHILQFSSKR